MCSLINSSGQSYPGPLTARQFAALLANAAHVAPGQGVEVLNKGAGLGYL